MTDLFCYLNSFHWTNNQNGLQHPGAQSTQHTSGAVQTTRLILCMITEEFKDSEPEEAENRVSI